MASRVSVCGRHFKEEEIAKIRELTLEDPAPCRREIARRTCELLGWVRPDGRLKEMSCRVALLRLEARGLIRLPPPRNGNGNTKPYRPTTTIVEPPAPLRCSFQDLGGLVLRAVETRSQSRLWNEAVSRFHYLGYKPLAGAQLRYLIQAGVGLVGVIGFGASAWKVGDRDRWIGWSRKQRRARLHLIANNARFLILPWIRTPNLASWVLSQCCRRLPGDWEQRYGYQPVLLETFVERDRFRATCYRAANWICVGETEGRGKLERHGRRELPVKKVYVYPLKRCFRRLLCGPLPQAPTV